MEIHKGKRFKLRELLEEIADAFRQDFPKIYSEQLRMVEDTNKSLVTPTGMSAGGQFMVRTKIHPIIYKFVKRHCGEDFFYQPENIDLLLNVWSALKVTREKKETFSGYGEKAAGQRLSNNKELSEGSERDLS
jgi:hypothetical protein